MLTAERGLGAVTIVPYSAAREHPTFAAAASAAFDAKTFAIVAPRGERAAAWALAGACSDEELAAVLGAALEPAGAAPGDDDAAAARGWRALEELCAPEVAARRLLPAQLRALARAEAEIADGARAPDAVPRTPENLAWRARQLLFVDELVASINEGAPLGGSASAWGRGLRDAHVAIAGGAAKEEKPSPRDLDACVKAAGWTLVTKQTSAYYPYPRRDTAPGQVPYVDVAALLRAFAEDSEVADDHVIYTVCDHLYAHEINFSERDAAGMTIEERVAAAGAPLRMGAQSPRAPDHSHFLNVIGGWKGKGILEKLTPEQIADPNECAVIMQMQAVVKGPLKMTREAEAALTSGDLVAIAREAELVAERLAAFVQQACAEEPELPAKVHHERALAEETAETKTRMVANGHGLGEYVHPAPLQYVKEEEYLASLSPTSHQAKNDLESCFYSIALGRKSQRFVCVEYDGCVYRFLRLCMGLKDSPLVASLLTAVLCDIASRRAAAKVDAYIDDFLVCQEPAVAAHVQATLVALLEETGARENVGKRVTAGPAAEMLGRVVDAPSGTISLPLPKLYKYQVKAMLVARLLASPDPRVRAAVTKSDIEELQGQLVWASGATLRGRCHVGGLTAAAMSPAAAGDYRDGILKDLTWWRTQWAAGAVRPDVALSRGPSAAAVLRVVAGGHAEETDGADAGGAGAAGAGGARKRSRAVVSDSGDDAGGALFGGEALHIAYAGTDAASESSDFTECLMLLAAAKRWDAQWRGRHMLFLTDNYGNVFNVMKGRARRPVVHDMIEELYARAEAGGYFFSVAWVPREANVAADALSKCATRAAAARECERLGVTLVAP